jgi:hypothetical protein
MIIGIYWTLEPGYNPSISPFYPRSSDGQKLGNRSTILRQHSAAILLEQYFTILNSFVNWFINLVNYIVIRCYKYHKPYLLELCS